MFDKSTDRKGRSADFPEQKCWSMAVVTSLHSLTVGASMGECACASAYREVESEIGSEIRRPGNLRSSRSDGHVKEGICAVVAGHWTAGKLHWNKYLCELS
jgi:hypothetical protein